VVSVVASYLGPSIPHTDATEIVAAGDVTIAACSIPQSQAAAGEFATDDSAIEPAQWVSAIATHLCAVRRVVDAVRDHAPVVGEYRSAKEEKEIRKDEIHDIRNQPRKPVRQRVDESDGIGDESERSPVWRWALMRADEAAKGAHDAMQKHVYETKHGGKVVTHPSRGHQGTRISPTLGKMFKHVGVAGGDYNGDGKININDVQAARAQQQSGGSS